MPPTPLATNHVNAPKVLKAMAKMTVPTRKTVKPIMLNLMKAKNHFFAFFPKLIFITQKLCFIDGDSPQRKMVTLTAPG